METHESFHSATMMGMILVSSNYLDNLDYLHFNSNTSFADKVFAPSHDIDMDKVDDSDRVVEQYKRFLAGFPSPSPDQPRVRPKVELDLKNIFKKKPQFSNGITSTEAN